MQLVLRRERLAPADLPIIRLFLANFLIYARLVLEADEKSIIERYRLHRVSITYGNPQRDIRIALFITIPLAILIGFLIYFKSPLSIAATILATFIFFLVLWYLIYQQIREEIRVGDLLNGRNFRARNVVHLIFKENYIYRMSNAFALIVEQARDWHEPEVIQCRPEPPNIVLTRSYESS